MKKTQVIRKTRPLKNSSVSKSGSENIGGIINILSKLDPQQLIGLANSVTNFATVGFEYAAEREKTKQVEIDAHIRSREIDAGREKSYLDHEQIMTRIQLEDRENERQFEIDMKNIGESAIDLKNKNENINRILDLLESGQISENMLVDTIHALKQ